MKRALIIGLLLGAFAAFADRTLSLTWSSSLSTVDLGSCSKGIQDGGWVASVSGTARLTSGQARDPDTFPDGGAYSPVDTQESGPAAACLSNLQTMGAAWKPNRGL